MPMKGQWESGSPPLIGTRKIGLDVVTVCIATPYNAFLPNGKKWQWHFSALTGVFKRTKMLLGMADCRCRRAGRAHERDDAHERAGRVVARPLTMLSNPGSPLARVGAGGLRGSESPKFRHPDLTPGIR